MILSSQPLSLPVQPDERNLLIDRVRGFALTGVLLANFTAYAFSEIPEAIAAAKSTASTPFLMQIFRVVLEWKFMTLFSILFGYGFGLIITSMERKGQDPAHYFIRRMAILFVFGVIHTLFWWGDVLHLYAISGMLLLLLRRLSGSALLFLSVLCMFVFSPVLSFFIDQRPEGFSASNVEAVYAAYTQNSWSVLFKSNLQFYYKAFLSTGADLRDIILTLGRFLFGYWLMRRSFFDIIARNKRLLNQLLLLVLPFAGAYFALQLYGPERFMDNAYLRESLMTFGITATTSFYTLLLIRAITWKPGFWLFVVLEKTGRMTLTNYLSVSLFAIVLLYGIGLGQMESTSLTGMWGWALVWYACMSVWSTLWLKKFRFGPMEFIWRKGTYGK